MGFHHVHQAVLEPTTHLPQFHEYLDYKREPQYLVWIWKKRDLTSSERPVTNSNAPSLRARLLSWKVWLEEQPS